MKSKRSLLEEAMKWKKTFSGHEECVRMEWTAAMVPRK